MPGEAAGAFRGVVGLPSTSLSLLRSDSGGMMTRYRCDSASAELGD